MAIRPVPFLATLVGCVGFGVVAIRFPVWSVGLLLAAIVLQTLRRRRALATKGWRVGSAGRDEICYEEIRDGRSEGFNLYCELQSGTPHHVIHFASNQFPPWAETRREEIVARIKSELKSPGYEYKES